MPGLEVWCVTTQPLKLCCSVEGRHGKAAQEAVMAERCHGFTGRYNRLLYVSLVVRLRI